MTGARLLDIINAQRSLKVLLSRVRDEDGFVDARRLKWVDAPAGLGWPHDGERVLAIFIKGAGGALDRPVLASEVSRLLDATLDAIVQANRTLLYDELIDSVELEVADLEAPLPLAHALGSLVPVVTTANAQQRLLSPSLPTVAQVRRAEAWLLLVLERVKRAGGPVTLALLVSAARDSRDESLGLVGWSRTLVAVSALQSQGLEDAAHTVRRAAQWWAGQSTFDPFPDSNGNGLADEVGGLQAVFDAFADVARSFEDGERRRARP
ncbi:MAG: hypothetical protein Q8S33_29270 [Myxococcales bacterium]|nr:hypothetical protein [Myxococcales bacterium]